jgi:hypothetical protein
MRGSGSRRESAARSLISDDEVEEPDHDPVIRANGSRFRVAGGQRADTAPHVTAGDLKDDRNDLFVEMDLRFSYG